MAITRRTDYAVRIMYELAQLPAGATLSVRDMCETAGVPENFAASIVTYLAAAALVRREGYNQHLLSLALPPEQITMAEIIRACEPEFSLSQCTREPEVCERSPRCGAHRMWLEPDALVWQRLNGITLAAVAAGMPDARGSAKATPTFTGFLGTA